MMIFPSLGRLRRSSGGFTLAELMISLGIFSMVTVGLISVHLFGQRYDQLVLSKLGASDQSRIGLNRMLEDIRTAKTSRVGTGSATSFTPITSGPKQGNALALTLYNPGGSLTTNYYYFDTAAYQLWRRVNNGTPVLLANHLTNITANSMTFRAEEPSGTVQTSATYKSVISVMLEFAQFQYPMTQVGKGNRYDYYKMELKAASHVPDKAVPGKL